MNPFKKKPDFDDDAQQIKRAIRNTAAKAIAESKDLGLTITYVKDGKIIEEAADGSKKIVGNVERDIKNKYYKGQKLYVKKN